MCQIVDPKEPGELIAECCTELCNVIANYFDCGGTKGFVVYPVVQKSCSPEHTRYCFTYFPGFFFEGIIFQVWFHGNIKMYE